MDSTRKASFRSNALRVLHLCKIRNAHAKTWPIVDFAFFVIRWFTYRNIKYRGITYLEEKVFSAFEANAIFVHALVDRMHAQNERKTWQYNLVHTEGCNICCTIFEDLET